MNFCGRIFNYIVNNYTEKREQVDQYEERIFAQTNLSDLEKIQIVNNEPLNEAELFVLVQDYSKYSDQEIQELIVQAE